VTGARRSELCGLKWTDIDLDDRRLTFRRAIVSGLDGRPVEKVGTKNRTVRTVWIDATTVSLMATYREAREADAADGTDIRMVAGRLGHRDASAPLDIYSHFLPERDREAADHLGDLVWPDKVDRAAHGAQRASSYRRRARFGRSSHVFVGRD